MPWPAKTAPMSTISTPSTPTPTLTARDYPPWLPDSAVHHRFLLGVLQESFHPVLLAEAGLLGPAERQLFVPDLQAVDPLVPRFALLAPPLSGRHARPPARRAA